MGMKVEWDCKNGHTNDPEDPNYSWLCCSECPAWRWGWLKWAAGGVVGLAVILVGYFLMPFLFQKPEAIYKNNYMKYALTKEEGKGKYELSPQRQKVLDELAKRHKFPEDQVKNLVQEAREDIYAKLVEENQANPTEERTKDINELVKKWNIKTPEETYKTKYREFILKQEPGKGKYEISPQEQKVLDELARRDKLPGDQVKNLVQEAQKGILVKLHEDYRQNPTPEKGGEIKDLAKKWGIDLDKLAEPKPDEPIKKPDEPVKKPEEPAKKPEPSTTVKTGADKIKELLQEGKLAEARKELAQGGPGVDPEMDKLRQDMETPTELVVNFQYQRPKSRPSEKLAVTSPRLADLYLTPKDNYRMFIETHSPCYLYIFQIDAEGRVERLFPNPFYNKTDNPVLPLLSLQIPFTHSEWLYLEEVGREAPPKKNTLYFRATPWPAKHLDELYGKLHRETNRETRNEILKEFMAALDGWKTAQIPALYFQEFSFFQVAKVPPAARPSKK